MILRNARCNDEDFKLKTEKSRKIFNYKNRYRVIHNKVRF